jgi:glycyl-tRNA synthetase beta chain
MGFWAIDEKPTGSKDPFALRRSALGSIRIILENETRLNFADLIESHLNLYRQQRGEGFGKDFDAESLQTFFTDRLKVHLRDRGIAHDLIDAVLSNSQSDDLVMVVKRVEALDTFLKTEDGANLLAGYKRAINIVTIEEKKDGPSIEYSGEVDESFFEHAQEKTLHAELQAAKAKAAVALKVEDFSAAMAAMAPLRGPVDAFFDAVIVNADDPTIRRNRLCLLNQIRKTITQVADFSKIEG